jgi:hypothetical protein
MKTPSKRKFRCLPFWLLDTYNSALAKRRFVSLFSFQIHRIAHAKTWGNSTFSYSNGFFPAETTFAVANIPALVKQGIKWVYVANNHLSRACIDYPYSTSGDNNNPPNKADQLNPAQDMYWKQSISRGVTPNNAVPFSFTPHYAQVAV